MSKGLVRYFNSIQKKIIQATQPIKTVIAGRGTGKSTVGGAECYNNVAQMPRSKGFVLGLTYNQILTKVLPPAMDVWSRFGLIKDVHYVVGKKPLPGYRLPYQPPEKFDYIISFFNGSAIELLSLDRKDHGRGGNYDWGYIDEAALIPKDRLDTEILPTLRGNKYRFDKVKRHQGILKTSSMPWLSSGYWLLDEAKLAIEHPKEYFYIESTALDNIHVLGQKYIDMLQRTLPSIVFDVEVMNKRITKLPNCFYPNFDDKKHCVYQTFHYDYNESGIYTKGDSDCISNKPLEVSFDFNAAFNSMVVCQENGNEFRILKEFFVKDYRTIDALVDEFINYYSGHGKKEVFIYGDRNGNNRVANSEITFYQQIVNRLTAAGWTCYLMVKGLDADHKLKHDVINRLFAEDNPRAPKIRINQNNCKYLIISIQNSPITLDFKKDKSSEKRNIDQERATHLSDCFDNIVYPKFSNLVTGHVAASPSDAEWM